MSANTPPHVWRSRRPEWTQVDKWRLFKVGQKVEWAVRPGKTWLAAEVKAVADAEAYKATAEERAAKAAEMEARKVIEDQLRSQMDPPLIALLSEHGLLVEVGQILIKEAGVTTLKDLNELSVDDLVSVGISHAAASKIQDIGPKLRAQIKGTMEEISEKAGSCKVS